MNENRDRRVQRTKNALRKALKTLILKNGYDSLTVRDIADEANVGRATFYLHYKDKDELLLECVDAIVQDFIVQVKRIPVADWGNSNEVPMLEVFQFAKENVALYRIIMQGHGGLKTAIKLQEIIAFYAQQVIEGQLALSEKAELPIPIEVVSNFFAGSLFSIINWWLEEEPPYSAQEMARMFRQLVMLNRTQLIGI
jgi:AcrR family transcriptional regulator